MHEALASRMFQGEPSTAFRAATGSVLGLAERTITGHSLIKAW